jgi:hypothetical protein
VIQNSLERLLGGVAAALREDIAPALEDEFARGQALAGAEILEQLVPRVQWRADEAAIAIIRPLLEEDAGDRDAHLRALAELQRGEVADRGPLLAAAIALVELERERLREARRQKPLSSESTNPRSLSSPSSSANTPS